MTLAVLLQAAVIWNPRPFASEELRLEETRETRTGAAEMAERVPVYISPAHTRIIGEIDGAEVDLGPVLLPELLMDSLDAEAVNQELEILCRGAAEEIPDGSWRGLGGAGGDLGCPVRQCLVFSL